MSPRREDEAELNRLVGEVAKLAFRVHGLLAALQARALEDNRARRIVRFVRPRVFTPHGARPVGGYKSSTKPLAEGEEAGYERPFDLTAYETVKDGPPPPPKPFRHEWAKDDDGKPQREP